MFPKKAIGSVVGIGGMAGGLGGVLVSKCGGWIFDAYRAGGYRQFMGAGQGSGIG